AVADLTADREGLLVGPQGLLGPVELPVGVGEAVEGWGLAAAVAYLTADREGLLVGPQGLLRPVELPVGVGQAVEGGRLAAAVPDLLVDAQRPAGQRERG